jgi:hypothetical protein
MRSLSVSVLIVALLAGCGAPAPNYKIVTLPSGRHIHVLGVGKILFSGDTPALMLKYQTEIPLDDKPSLDKEVDEIWGSFQSDVEKAGLINAIVSANEKPAGFIVTTNKSYNYVYKHGPDGKWARVGS